MSTSVASRKGRWFMLVLLAGLLCGLAWVLTDEVQTSRWQAHWLSRLAPELHYTLEPGASPHIRFPGDGPFDERLGYHRLPERVQRLQQQGFVVTAQARMSPRMLEVVDQGLFAPYHEKSLVGLDLLDCREQPLAAARYPQRSYSQFDAVPALLVDALLFIENRELLDPRFPKRNPAVEWDRFGKAVADQALRRIHDGHAAAGGSTLATQIEKYRHSPEGRTDSGAEKLRQMASASLRAYLDGEHTLARRQQIVVDYLNTVPLSARAGFGEVNGLGDGLWAWYRRDFAETNQLLALPVDTAPVPPQRRALAFRQALIQPQALAFKQALALMVAQRRPSYYLDAGVEELRRLTDSHLRVLAEAGVIAPALRDAALPLPVTPLPPQRVALPGSFVERKAVNAVRGKLQSLLAMPRAYDVERLDLTLRSTLDAELQRAATLLLRGLGDPQQAHAAGLYGFRLLKQGDDPSRINFSFTLYERGERSNRLRAQVDSLDQPFDLNEGARLDLGSTAKLRTLVTYLELVAGLHQRWADLTPQQLAAEPVNSRDALGRWARAHLAQATDKSLAAMLEAAMARSYSASPAESFFTGGGLHEFENFEPEDNVRTMSVTEALTRSVNLVFVRLMRDVAQHIMARSAGANAALLDDVDDPRRQPYLERFADREGREFIARFHRKYAGRPAAEAEALFVRGLRPQPERLAAAYLGVEPDAGIDELAAFLGRHLPQAAPSGPALRALHQRTGAGRWSLVDRAYRAGVHPLELWTLAQLRRQPATTLGEAFAASTEQRQQAYGWLFSKRQKAAQDARIRKLLEVDAFAEIHKSWRRLGYPFEALTPSYASALGASGDRPAALAELMGIIVNGGLRLPVERVTALRFAQATPYETHLAYQPTQAERVLAPEVAQLLRRALIGVVENGTAKRLRGTLKLRDGTPVEIGGKTGTGDHRFDTHGRDGKVLTSRVVNRSATLVFLIGDRYYGTLMAYAHEPWAASYRFTSAMPTQLLKTLSPVLQALVDGGGCSAGGVDAQPEAALHGDTRAAAPAPMPR